MTTVQCIIKKYKNHGGIVNIKNEVDKPENRCDITLATVG